MVPSRTGRGALEDRLMILRRAIHHPLQRIDATKAHQHLAAAEQLEAPGNLIADEQVVGGLLTPLGLVLVHLDGLLGPIVGCPGTDQHGDATERLAIVLRKLSSMSAPAFGYPAG